MTKLDLGALFLLGLLGSTHCLAMCSAFVLCVAQRSRASSFAYQAGRLVSYATLGAVLGAFGLGLRFTWDQAAGRWMLMVAGVLIILLGLVQGGLLRLPDAGSAYVQRKLGRFLRTRSLLGPAGLGLFTGLLPCPLLYAGVVRAVAAASPMEGALGMGAFWLGTLPAMASVSLLTPWLSSHGRQWWPRLALVATVALGALTLYHGLTTTTGSCPNCH